MHQALKVSVEHFMEQRYTQCLEVHKCEQRTRMAKCQQLGWCYDQGYWHRLHIWVRHQDAMFQSNLGYAARCISSKQNKHESKARHMTLPCCSFLAADYVLFPMSTNGIPILVQRWINYCPWGKSLPPSSVRKLSLETGPHICDVLSCSALLQQRQDPKPCTLVRY